MKFKITFYTALAVLKNIAAVSSEKEKVRLLTPDQECGRRMYACCYTKSMVNFVKLRGKWGKYRSARFGLNGTKTCKFLIIILLLILSKIVSEI